MKTWSVRELDRKLATEILSWTYETPYDFYNNEVSEEAYEEILDGSYYVIVDENQTIIGFFCSGLSAQVPAGHKVKAYENDCIDIGLGMNPILTGAGLGYTFCTFILNEIKKHYQNNLRLTVAKFNKRAIYLYKKLGFIEQKQFNTPTTSFITMEKD